jgi:hypothetical protein
MKNYKRLLTTLLAVWFVFAVFASSLHLFKSNDNRLGPAVAFAAGIPLIIFFLWFTASPKFRQFTLSLDPATLTAVQAWRFIGFIFPLLEARTMLPAVFALPAGYGDMFIGVTAVYVAWKLTTPTYRNAFILWQILGLADLATAVTMGITARLITPHDAAITPMTVLPLSIIPTFLVPLFFILHFICIAQATTWQSSSSPIHSTRRQPA